MKKKIYYDLYFWGLLLFSGFIVAIPKLLSVFIPCLQKQALVSYEYPTCNTIFIVDRFIFLAIVGLSILTTIMIWTISKYKSKHTKINFRSMLPLMLTIVTCVVFTISSYYIYLPHVEKNIRKVPIILESVPK